MDLPMEDTALAGCAGFQVASPATGAAPVTIGGKLHIEEAAESMTAIEVR